MKKIIALSLITMSMFCASAFANPVNAPQPAKVLSIFHVNERTLQELALGKHPDYVLEFPANTSIPVAFFIRGDVVDLVENPANFSQIKIKKTFYTRVRDGKMQFSMNLSDWKEFTGFFTGVTSVNLAMDEGLPLVNFGLEANVRAK